jgi:DNA-binding transcriptional ArsR family regulator
MVERVELTDEQMDRIFHALSQTTRRDMLRRTLEAERSVSELAREYDMSFAAVHKHVSVLERAELVIKRVEGSERRIRENPDMIARARTLLAQYEAMWRARIARLDELLAEDPKSSDPNTSA